MADQQKQRQSRDQQSQVPVSEVNLNRPYKGMYTDSAIAESPKETYRFLLNGVDATTTGDENFVSNERSNAHVTSLPEGFYDIGSVYIGDGQTAVFSTNKEGTKQLIGILDKDDVYRNVVETEALNFKISHQIDAEYRVRRGFQKTVYWSDGLNPVRTFNFSNLKNFYTEDFIKWIEHGNDPDLYVGEKWDIGSFSLVKTHDGIPEFVNVEVLEFGETAPGSYNFAIQLVDQDLNPTGWLNTSRPVLIYNDYTSKPYKRIRGSKNVITSAQNFGPAIKSIRLTVDNLDEEYPYYRIATIQANETTGEVNKAFVSGLISTKNPHYIYTGNDTSLTETPVEEIIIEGVGSIVPKHVAQLENKLITANEIGSQYNWCDFQAFASKIKADLTTTPVILNTLDSFPNVKNPHSTFEVTGYMPGEVYSLGICYIMKDNSRSPVFHIPGRPADDASSKMGLFVHEESTYIDTHSCLGGENYWGKDYLGHELRNTGIRHHRFPTRIEAGKPLIQVQTTPVPITKYKLTVKFTLAGTWPTNPDGTDASIGWAYTYWPALAASPYTVGGYLSKSDMGKDITIYEEVNPLQTQTGGVYLIIDPNCELETDHDGLTTHTEFYDGGTTTDTVVDAVTSELFGLAFSNIEKPHPDVIGFYIVQHERLETDKSILGTAIIGPNQIKGDFTAFGLICPKSEASKMDDNSAWFWNAEHEFLNLKRNFKDISIQGAYEEIGKDLPTKLPLPNNQHYMVHITEDVYPGTSYNAEVHKKNNKDDDGFSLVNSYRNFRMSFNTNIAGLNLNDHTEPLYIDATANKIEAGKIFYNVSCDNKIGMLPYPNGIPDSYFQVPGSPEKTRLLYGALTVENKDPYPDYLTRVYYKTHNNPFLFGEFIEPISVFGGDVFISPAHFVSTVFMEQAMRENEKKSRVWQIVVGALIIVAAVVVTIVTEGAAAPLLALAINYGVSMITSGIKFEQMKSMFDNDYPKGLVELVQDQDTMYTTKGVYNHPGPIPGFTPHTNDVKAYSDDDSFIWHADKVTDLWTEGVIPYALRCGATGPLTDFIDAPSPNWDEKEFQHYLVDKLTIVDNAQGSGRLYKGYPTAEYYNENPDYRRINKQTIFYHLPVEFDCCAVKAGKGERFPVRIRYSEESFQEELGDNYGAFLPNNYRDIQGEFGEITGLYTVGNQLFIQTPEALWRLPAAKQERATNQIVTFIGTGEFFSMPPQRVSEDHLISGGTEHKWATVKTRFGVVSVSEAEGRVHLHTGDGIKELSDFGMYMWFRDNLKSYLAAQMEILAGEPYPLNVNPANPDGIGIHATYDSELARVIITKRDYIFLQANALGFEVVDTPPSPLGVRFKIPDLGGVRPYRPYFSYDKKSGLFYRGVDEQEANGDIYRTYEQLTFDNGQFFENRSWTISFSIAKMAWRGFHSYIPLSYISKPKSFFALIDHRIWRYNVDGHFQTFFGKRYPHILEYVATPSPLVTNIWESMKLFTTSTRFDFATQNYYAVDVTFNRLIAFNSKQSTVEWTLTPKQAEPIATYMMAQVVNNVPGEILISREENSWNINDLRDYRIDYGTPVFRTDWISLMPTYPIDKVLNYPAVSVGKDWTILESLRDVYIAVRLTFDNFDDVSLTTNYVIDFQHKSMS